MSDWWDDAADLNSAQPAPTNPGEDLPPTPFQSPQSGTQSPPPDAELDAELEAPYLGSKSLDGSLEQLVGYHIRALFSFDGLCVSTYKKKPVQVTSQNVDTVTFFSGEVFLYVDLEASDLGHLELDNSSDWWIVKDARNSQNYARIPSLEHCRRLGLTDPYEAVELVKPGGHAVRPIVFLGPLREEVNDLLLAETDDVEKYRTCVPYTSREMRDQEIAGMDYNFVSQEEIKYMVANEEFIEHLEYRGHVYGTTYDSIRDAVSEGYAAFLPCYSPHSPPVNHISYYYGVVSGHRCVLPYKYRKILGMLLN